MQRFKSVWNSTAGKLNAKRKRGSAEPADQENQGAAPSPKRARRAELNGELEEGHPAQSTQITTPTKRKRGRPPGSRNKANLAPTFDDAAPPEPLSTPRSTARRLFETPQKPHKNSFEDESIEVIRNSDRSARRKCARTLIERTISSYMSDEGDEEEEDTLAEQIWDEDEAHHEDRGQDVLYDSEEPNAPVTPAKRVRGRPKGSRRKRTPTPPQDLPHYEQYFFKNRPGRVKTSSNTLSSLSLLTHEEYFTLIRNQIDPHESERAYLEELHSRSFDQWAFELSQGFNICIHGYGSKRQLVSRFAEYLNSTSPRTQKIVIVNGHLPTLTIRDILHTLARAALPPDLSQKLSGTQPFELLTSFLTLLSVHKEGTPHLTLLINAIDSPTLRRPNTQSLLSRLASHPSIHLLATASHPSFPLLWDSSLRTAFNFVFHDCTTFRPPDASELDVVNSVHELLGRSGRRIGGKEGVAFVLKSLPEKARALFRLLVAEQLAGMLEKEDGDAVEGAANGDDGGEADEASGAVSAAGGGVEYRVLYQKATEEFICSSEMTFRTLLKEFHDHQMISSRRDVLSGTGAAETLWAPFSKEELEAILEDLVD
ncbi:MAG: Origin recognition complex subunit 2 [Sclerophora amabilis]|nr:MAG: Origin recognition complex subunit 2 [Sclerophora amabilis]